MKTYDNNDRKRAYGKGYSDSAIISAEKLASAFSKGYNAGREAHMQDQDDTLHLPFTPDEIHLMCPHCGDEGYLHLRKVEYSGENATLTFVCEFGHVVALVFRQYKGFTFVNWTEGKNDRWFLS